MVFGITTVNQQIPFFQVRGNLLDDRIHRSAGLDHHQDAARVLELIDEILKVGCPLNVFTCAGASEELFGLGVGAVVDDA